MKTFLCWRGICSVCGIFASVSAMLMAAYMELSADLGEASSGRASAPAGHSNAPDPAPFESAAIPYPAMRKGGAFLPPDAGTRPVIDAALLLGLPSLNGSTGGMGGPASGRKEAEPSAKAELEKAALGTASKADEGVPSPGEGSGQVSLLPAGSAGRPESHPVKAKASKAAPPPSLKRTVMSEVEIHLLIHRIAASHGLDPLLVQAVIRMESMFDPRAVSPRGAMGLMQITKQTAKHLGIEDPWDIEENLEGGTRYLKELVDLYPEKLEHALAAYNAGPYAVKLHKGVPPYEETRLYVKRVMDEYQRLMREARLHF